MNNTVLERLLDTQDRFFPSINSDNDERLTLEFGYEKMLSLLCKRLIGVSNSDFRLNIRNMSVEIGGRLVSEESSVLSDYYTRFLEEQDNIYSKVLDKFGEVVTLYKLDPIPPDISNYGTDEGEDDSEPTNTYVVDAIEFLTHLNHISDDLSGLGKASPDLKSYLSELYDWVTLYGETADYPLFCIYVIKSREIAELLCNKETESPLVQKALTAFCNVFGDTVVDGVYWGYYSCGDARQGGYDDDIPMILDYADIASLIILYERLKNERR